jgi:hypothetical protein
MAAKFVPPPPMGTFGKLTRSGKKQGRTFDREQFRKFWRLAKEAEAKRQADKDAQK